MIYSQGKIVCHCLESKSIEEIRKQGGVWICQKDHQKVVIYGLA